MSRRLTKEAFEELCDSRNHTLVSFNGYTSIKSVLEFRCNICGHQWFSSAASYKNSKSGCWGCKKKAISSFTKNRVFTEKGREKLSLLRKGKPSWNKGIKGSVPGGYNKDACWGIIKGREMDLDILYFVIVADVTGKLHYKIGRSFYGPSSRLQRSLVTVIATWEGPHWQVWWAERTLLDRYSGSRSSPTPTLSSTGGTECFADIPVREVISVTELLLRQ